MRFYLITRLLNCASVLIPNHGYNRLKNPYINVGLSNAYSQHAQNMQGVRGLVPKGAVLPEDKLNRLMDNIQSKVTNIEKYTFLHNLKDTSELLYFSLLCKYTEELMPIVYTPTVGTACLQWSELYNEQVKGLYISVEDKGRINECLSNWPNTNIKVIVFTDGERILGLGDLGSNGMGIPIGKLALYTACAGISPDKCLPIQIDVGCNNDSIINDPYYIGIRQPRLNNSSEYNSLIEELITTAKKKYGPTTLFQFEDFGNKNAFKLLNTWKIRATCFNDDIQGTACVVLGGLLAAERMDKGGLLEEQVFLFYGAGEAGCGIADLISKYIKVKTGCSTEQSRENIWLYDSKGLVEKSRQDISDYKMPYAHENQNCNSFECAIECIKPTVLIGVSGQGQSFTKNIIEQFVKGINVDKQNPVIMALSNPTSKAECTADQAYEWSNNRAVFISGSPFKSVKCSDKIIRTPGQGNNAYVFPGIGLGAVSCGATIIEDDDFIVTAEILAKQVPEKTLRSGSCYPPLNNIRNVSTNIAVGICNNQWNKGTAAIKKPTLDISVFDWIRSKMYNPVNF